MTDGGFATHEDIDDVSAPQVGCTVYAPVPKPKDPTKDRYAPHPKHSAAVAAWRQRMATPQAQAIRLPDHPSHRLRCPSHQFATLPDRLAEPSWAFHPRV